VFIKDLNGEEKEEEMGCCRGEEKEEEMGGEEMVTSKIKKEEMGERNYKLNE
jgi:hypothetical protein